MNRKVDMRNNYLHKIFYTPRKSLVCHAGAMVGVVHHAKQISLYYQENTSVKKN